MRVYLQSKLSASTFRYDPAVHLQLQKYDRFAEGSHRKDFERTTGPVEINNFIDTDPCQRVRTGYGIETDADVWYQETYTRISGMVFFLDQA